MTASTTGLVVWLVDRFVFRGEVPFEVYAWLQFAVPAATGLISAEIARRRQACRQGES